MKKILFISTNDHVPWGGSEVLWSQIAARLLSSGRYEVGISPKKWVNELAPINQLLKSGALDFRRSGDVPVPRMKRWANRLLPWHIQWKPQREGPIILSKAKPDFVVLSLGDHNSGAGWMTLCREMGIPYLLIVQLVREGHVPFSNEDYYYELKKGYQKAERVFCVSEDNKCLLEKQFASAMTNALVIHNPIPSLSALPPYPTTDIVNWAMVASLNLDHKGQDILFEVLRLEKWKSRAIQINLYGTGPHEQLLRDLAKHWKIANIAFQGYRSFQDIWASNQLLILPSRMEGLSLAFLEASYCERASIITELGDTKRFITDNVSGFLVKAPKADLLDDAMEKAWQRRSDWETMGKSARNCLNAIVEEDPVLNATRVIEDMLSSTVVQLGLREDQT